MKRPPGRSAKPLSEERRFLLVREGAERLVVPLRVAVVPGASGLHGDRLTAHRYRSRHENHAPSAIWMSPGLLDAGQRQSVHVQGYLLGGHHFEEALVRGRGLREPGPPA